jgi:hypothetical protein
MPTSARAEETTCLFQTLVNMRVSKHSSLDTHLYLLEKPRALTLHPHCSSQICLNCLEYFYDFNFVHNWTTFNYDLEADESIVKEVRTN